MRPSLLLVFVCAACSPTPRHDAPPRLGLGKTDLPGDMTLLGELSFGAPMTVDVSSGSGPYGALHFTGAFGDAIDVTIESAHSYVGSYSILDSAGRGLVYNGLSDHLALTLAAAGDYYLALADPWIEYDTLTITATRAVACSAGGCVSTNPGCVAAGKSCGRYYPHLPTDSGFYECGHCVGAFTCGGGGIANVCADAAGHDWKSDLPTSASYALSATYTLEGVGRGGERQLGTIECAISGPGPNAMPSWIACDGRFGALDPDGSFVVEDTNGGYYVTAGELEPGLRLRITDHESVWPSSDGRGEIEWGFPCLYESCIGGAGDAVATLK